MADKDTTWFGTVSGDWDVAGNWDNGVPETVAGDKDTIVVSKDAVNAMDTNLDRTGDNAGAGLDCSLFYVEEGGTLPIGTSGAPLMLAADKIVHRGTGLFSYKATDGTGALTTDNIIIDSDRTDSDAFTLDNANGVNITRLSVFKGMVRLKASLGANSVTNSFFSYRTSPLTDVIVNIEAAATQLLVAMRMNGGRVTNARQMAIAEVYNGRLEQNALAQAYVQSGGNVVHTDNTTIGVMQLFGGTMDLRRVAGRMTITDLYEFTGSRFLFNKDLVTITNDNTSYKN